MSRLRKNKFAYAFLLLLGGFAVLVPGVILIVEGTTDEHFFLSILCVVIAAFCWARSLYWVIEGAGEEKP